MTRRDKRQDRGLNGRGGAEWGGGVREEQPRRGVGSTSEKTSKETRRGREAGRKMTGEGGEGDKKDGRRRKTLARCR